MDRRAALAAISAVGLVIGLLVAGTTSATAADPLVSQGKAITVSSVEGGQRLEAAKAVDGSTTTRWASAEGSDSEWLRVDLGTSHAVSRVRLTWEDAYAKGYRVQTSPEGSAWTDVFSTSAGDGGVDDLTVSGAGRYVRVLGTARGTAWGYSLWEVEVYGVAGGTPPTTTTTTPPSNGLGYAFGSRQTPYAAGVLRPSGSTSTLDAAVVDYYQRWKSAFVRQNCGNGWYQVISPDADHPYVAEAQGYGMVVVATMAGADPDAKKIFDGLVKWKIDHPSSINRDLLAAEQDVNCRSVNGGDGATDGDMDVAYGLLLADRQWGSAGTYNYKQLAIRHVNAIKASEVNPSTNLLKLGDWTSSGDQYYYLSRSSDWMADHFRAFRKATGDAAWDTIRSAHQNLISTLQQNFAPNTGLLPDFVENTNSSAAPTRGPGAGGRQRRQVLVERLPRAVADRRGRGDQWRLPVPDGGPQAQHVGEVQGGQQPEQHRHGLPAQRHADLRWQCRRVLRAVRRRGRDRSGRSGVAGRVVEQDAADADRRQQLLLGEHPAPGDDHGDRQPLGALTSTVRSRNNGLYLLFRGSDLHSVANHSH